MKILNLYAGVGGNRKLWGNEHEVTAVENDWNILKIYKEFFPKDLIVCGDAHQYLLEHFREFDFIWSSPPCPTHSVWGRLRMLPGEKKFDGQRLSETRYPDMALYQEILLLKHFFKGKYCVENVVSYYEPLIAPLELAGHYFWTNFSIGQITFQGRMMGKKDKIGQQIAKTGFDLSPYKGIDKRKALRNCVEPETGKHILDCMLKPNTLF